MQDYVRLQTMGIALLSRHLKLSMSMPGTFTSLAHTQSYHSVMCDLMSRLKCYEL